MGTNGCGESQIDRYQKLKKSLEDYERQRTRNETEIDVLVKDLKEKHGIGRDEIEDNIKELKIKLSKSEKRLAKMLDEAEGILNASQGE